MNFGIFGNGRFACDLVMDCQLPVFAGRMDALNTENHRQDNAIEVLVHWVVFGLLVTGILLVLAYGDEIDCWLSPGTDACVQCIDDCLEPESTKEGA